MSITRAKKDLRKYASRNKARELSRFFKTGEGEYGEGDIFIGITVPNIRKVANKYQDLPLKQAIKLLKSPVHEDRLLALLIMVLKFQRTQTEAQKNLIYKAYLTNTKYINNWDLVDSSKLK